MSLVVPMYKKYAQQYLIQLYTVTVFEFMLIHSGSYFLFRSRIFLLYPNRKVRSDSSGKIGPENHSSGLTICFSKHILRRQALTKATGQNFDFVALRKTDSPSLTGLSCFSGSRFLIPLEQSVDVQLLSLKDSCIVQRKRTERKC